MWTIRSHTWHRQGFLTDDFSGAKRRNRLCTVYALTAAKISSFIPREMIYRCSYARAHWHRDAHDTRGTITANRDDGGEETR